MILKLTELSLAVTQARPEQGAKSLRATRSLLSCQMLNATAVLPVPGDYT